MSFKSELKKLILKGHCRNIQIKHNHLYQHFHKGEPRISLFWTFIFLDFFSLKPDESPTCFRGLMTSLRMNPKQSIISLAVFSPPHFLTRTLSYCSKLIVFILRWQEDSSPRLQTGGTQMLWRPFIRHLIIPIRLRLKNWIVLLLLVQLAY